MEMLCVSVGRLCNEKQSVGKVILLHSPPIPATHPALQLSLPMPPCQMEVNFPGCHSTQYISLRLNESLL
jgi:hypothetical protein